MLDTLGNLERTHTCGELRESHVGEQVVLMGWVAKKRDFGVFTFIDLRDREGITQIVVSSEAAPDAHAKAKNLRGEFVIAVKGEVVSRGDVGISALDVARHQLLGGDLVHVFVGEPGDLVTHLVQGQCARRGMPRDDESIRATGAYVFAAVEHDG